MPESPPLSVRDELLTTGEVSAITKVPATTLRAWRHDQTGPKSFKLGGLTRYRRSDLEAWLNRQYTTTQRTKGTTA